MNKREKKELQARWGYPTVYTLLRINGRHLITFNIAYNNPKHWWIWAFHVRFEYDHGGIKIAK
jgi:hypothetical protein